MALLALALLYVVVGTWVIIPAINSTPYRKGELKQVIMWWALWPFFLASIAFFGMRGGR